MWIAEADDYSAPEFLASMVERLDSRPEAGMAYCQSVIVDETDAEVGRFPSEISGKQAEWLVDFDMAGHEVCSRYMLNQNRIVNASAVVFRKDAYDRAGGAEEAMRLCGDWLTYVKILAISDFAYVASPYNYYRTHSRSVRKTTAVLRAAREVAIVQSLVRAHTALTERERQLHLANFQCWSTLAATDGKRLSGTNFASALALNIAGIKAVTRSQIVRALHQLGLLGGLRGLLGR